MKEHLTLETNMSVYTTVCSCGGATSAPSPRPGEQPKTIHYDVNGRPAPCPLDR
ncbi:hypothetical protein ACFWA5_45760 [Streptomyces mirabilis]|uniref:hypothetical protein n=1 Tax=Streptomyces mirabilis TaxID=68239 RepID=UPI00364CCB30